MDEPSLSLRTDLDKVREMIVLAGRVQILASDSRPREAGCEAFPTLSDYSKD